MQLSEIRSLQLYKTLLEFGLSDRTGPRQEKTGKLKVGINTKYSHPRITYPDDEWLLKDGGQYSGSQTSPTGDKPVSGKKILVHLRGAANKIWLVFDDNESGYNDAFKVILAYMLGIRAPYRIVENESGERILIEGIFEE